LYQGWQNNSCESSPDAEGRQKKNGPNFGTGLRLSGCSRKVVDYLREREEGTERTRYPLGPWEGGKKNLGTEGTRAERCAVTTGKRSDNGLRGAA